MDAPVSVREIKLNQCLGGSVLSAILARFLRGLPLPSLFVLLGSAFLRNFRCILSISVPCANFTSASVRATRLTLIHLCRVAQSSIQVSLFPFFPCCNPRRQDSESNGCGCDCPDVVVSETAGGWCSSGFEYTNSSFHRSSCHLWYLAF